ncbi:MAG: hypothetical protein D6797_06315, partial [Bdellovibrio sp.]
KVRFAILFFLILILSLPLEAKKKVKYRKTQKVSFEGTSIDGEARTPDGAYLHQRRGVDFAPLYKVRKQFDENIKDSIEYLR